MPGKVNPVIPEVVNQVAFNIMGNDLTITMAAEAGQLELNAFEPIIFWNLTHAVEFLTYAVNTPHRQLRVGHYRQPGAVQGNGGRQRGRHHRPYPPPGLARRRPTLPRRPSAPALRWKT